MKNLITILILFAVGCGQTETQRLEEEKLTQEYETEFQMSEDENKRLEAELESNKLKALKAETDKTKKEPPTNPTDQNTTKSKPVKEQGRKLTLEEKKVVGEYEFEDEDRITWKYVLLENGILEFSENGEKKKDGTWKMALLRFELGKEVHVDYENSKSFYKIESNGDLTEIANIIDREREEVPKVQTTYKKIK